MRSLRSLRSREPKLVGIGKLRHAHASACSHDGVEAGGQQGVLFVHLGREALDLVELRQEMGLQRVAPGLELGVAVLLGHHAVHLGQQGVALLLHEHPCAGAAHGVFVGAGVLDQALREFGADGVHQQLARGNHEVAAGLHLVQLAGNAGHELRQCLQIDARLPQRR